MNKLKMHVLSMSTLQICCFVFFERKKGKKNFALLIILSLKGIFVRSIFAKIWNSGVFQSTKTKYPKYAFLIRSYSYFNVFYNEVMVYEWVTKIFAWVALKVVTILLTNKKISISYFIYILGKESIFYIDKLDEMSTTCMYTACQSVTKYSQCYGPCKM